MEAFIIRNGMLDQAILILDSATLPAALARLDV